MTSAMTRGCRNLESGQCNDRQKIMMIPACKDCNVSGKHLCTLWCVSVAYLNNEHNQRILRIVN